MLSAATTSPPAPAHRGRNRGQPRLKFVDDRREFRAAHAREFVREPLRIGDRGRGVARERARRHRVATERHEHLADRGAVVVDRPPEPLPGAEEVTAVDLGDVLDAGRGRQGEVDRLAARLRQCVERRSREFDDVALDHAALGDPEDRRPGTESPALAVLFDEPAPLERRDQA